MALPDTPHPPPDGAGFEADRVPAARLALTIGALLAGLAVLMGATALLLDLIGGPRSSDTFRSPTDAPTLQSNPRSDLATYTAAQQRELSAYRWIDRQEGTVGIPIEQAMNLLLERGVPGGDSGRTRLQMRQRLTAPSDHAR